MDQRVEDGERGFVAGEEVEGFGGVEASVSHTLVEEVPYSHHVSISASFVNLLVVVSGGGLVRKWLVK